MTARIQYRMPRLRLLAGWCALLVYLGVASPIGVVMTAVVGEFDRDHSLQVDCTESGVKLVMHHDARCANHHHGLAARALSLLARSDDPTNPDHVVQFNSSTAATKESQVSAPARSDERGIDMATVDLSLGGAMPGFVPAAVFPRPPPICEAQMLCLRTTILLI